MINIKFESPGIDFNPLSFFNGFSKIPNSAGVYIWGYMIHCDGKKKFCPVNVGQSTNLRERLIEHYSCEISGNSAFFEFNKIMGQENLEIVNKSMEKYYYLPSGKNRIEEANKIKMLLYYQDRMFFKNKISKKSFSITNNDKYIVEDRKGRRNINYRNLVEILKKSKYKKDINLLIKLNNWFDTHTNNFFAIYFEYTNDFKNEYEHNILKQTNKNVEESKSIIKLKNKLEAFSKTNNKEKVKEITEKIKKEINYNRSKTAREIIENTVNRDLAEQLGIYTIADRKSDCLDDYQIDLSCVSKCLINLLDKKPNSQYLNPDGTYINELKIPLPPIINT
jgi:hypothetical protein